MLIMMLLAPPPYIMLSSASKVMKATSMSVEANLVGPKAELPLINRRSLIFESKAGLGTAEIEGIIIGVTVIIALSIIGWWIWWKRRFFGRLRAQPNPYIHLPEPGGSNPNSSNGISTSPGSLEALRPPSTPESAAVLSPAPVQQAVPNEVSHTSESTEDQNSGQNSAQTGLSRTRTLTPTRTLSASAYTVSTLPEYQPPLRTPSSGRSTHPPPAYWQTRPLPHLPPV